MSIFEELIGLFSYLTLSSSFFSAIPITIIPPLVFASAETSGLSLTKQTNVSAQINTLINTISNSVDIDEIKKCSQSSSQAQAYNIKDVGNVYLESITFEQANAVIIDCIQNTTIISESVTELANVINQSNSSGTIGGLNTESMIIIGVVILVVLFALYLLYRYFSSGNSSSTKVDINVGSANPLDQVPLPPIKKSVRFEE